MTFREALEEHLRALKSRDLPALIATLPEGELTMIAGDGRIVRSVDEYVALLGERFASDSWTLEARLEELTECEALGLAVIHQTCRDEPPGGDRVVERSYRTLAFARQGERWVMIHDQCTPIRAAAPPAG